MKKKLLLALCSVVLFAVGGINFSGITLLCALVPLLLISRSYDSSCRSFFGMLGWVTVVFMLWALAAAWSAWYNGHVDIAVAALVHGVVFAVVFMLYHYVSKRCRPILANVILVCGWIAAEYFSLDCDIISSSSLLGNGLSNDIWAIQWYEYTGVLGGSLWILMSNLLIFNAIIHKDKKSRNIGTLWIVIPIIISIVMFFGTVECLGQDIAIMAKQSNISVCAENGFNNQSFYACNGDYLGRLSSYIFVLSILYYVVYRFRRKSHLIAE